MLKLGLVEGHASTEAARGQLAVCWRELSGEHHVAVRVDGADLPEAAGLDRQTVGQLTAALIKGQQADAIAIGGADEPSIRAETQLLNVSPPHVGLLNVVGEAEGAARGDERASGCSLLELIHTRPLEGERTKRWSSIVSITPDSESINHVCVVSGKTADTGPRITVTPTNHQWAVV